ncbi:AAA family ATPase [Bacteroidia bacterium]|nr:AAA family ATPase [Bacteroidia bacterium]
MKFSDLKEFHRNNVSSRRDIKVLQTISGLANQHATYYYLVYSEILKYLPNKLEQQKVKFQPARRENYVIIIDEINRANISRVFGELITLIEPDKRSNGSIPLEVRLPSGDKFIVPSNLYIIGTMNTADKSIALLDIALRRRFEFEPMYPKYEIEGKVIQDVEVLNKLNTKIIETKGHDFQIGHAYFMDDSTNLVQRMNRKVIPLLLEYYMNDEKEVKQILNYAGLNVEENSWPLRIIG